MTTRRRKRHSPEQIVWKLRDADATLNAGKELGAVLQSLEVSEATYVRWRAQYGGMKAEEAVRLKKLEDENRRSDIGATASVPLDEGVAPRHFVDLHSDHFALHRNWRQDESVKLHSRSVTPASRPTNYPNATWDYL